MIFRLKRAIEGIENGLSPDQLDCEARGGVIYTLIDIFPEDPSGGWAPFKKDPKKYLPYLKQKVAKLIEIEEYIKGKHYHEK